MDLTMILGFAGNIGISREVAREKAGCHLGLQLLHLSARDKLQKREPVVGWLQLFNNNNMLDKIFGHPFKLLFHRKVADKAKLDTAGLAVLREIDANTDVPLHTAFYFYFPDPAAAQRVADQLRARDFAVIVDRPALGTDWLVLASKEMLTQSGSIEDLRTEFEAMAGKEGGEYDGWEVELADHDLDKL
jgi:hypothetical protein